MGKIGCELWLQMKEIAHLFTKFHTNWVLVSKKKNTLCDKKYRSFDTFQSLQQRPNRKDLK